MYVFFFSSRRRHTRYWRDWSSDVCSSDLVGAVDLQGVYGEALDVGEVGVARPEVVHRQLHPGALELAQRGAGRDVVDHDALRDLQPRVTRVQPVLLQGREDLLRQAGLPELPGGGQGVVVHAMVEALLLLTQPPHEYPGEREECPRGEGHRGEGHRERPAPALGSAEP